MSKSEEFWCILVFWALSKGKRPLEEITIDLDKEDPFYGQLNGYLIPRASNSGDFDFSCFGVMRFWLSWNDLSVLLIFANARMLSIVFSVIKLIEWEILKSHMAVSDEAFQQQSHLIVCYFVFEELDGEQRKTWFSQ